MAHDVSGDSPPLGWIIKRFIIFLFIWAQTDVLPTAPLLFSTSLLWFRYQFLAKLEERCRFFFHNSLQSPVKSGKNKEFSVLHNAYTAFAYRIRAPPHQ